jgi:hypothetical protein
MVATAPERPSTGFILFSALSVISTGMFAVNLGATMLIEPKPEAEQEEESSSAAEAVPSSAPEAASQTVASSATEGKPAPATAPQPAPRVDPDMRVGEILTRWPQTVDTFVGHGFSSLASPEHREQVKQIPITLRMACQRHNVDLDYMVSELNEAISPSFAARATSAATEGKPAAGKAAKGKLAKGETIGADHILGEILAAYPETEKVFRKYYGDGCFSCPGQATESVKQSAMMHNVSEKQLLSELNRAAGV